MLKNLSIKNYALIDELELDFGTGLNIITGETGAGKSIIIDALNLILGERATAEEVRSGTEKSSRRGSLHNVREQESSRTPGRWRKKRNK